MLFWMKACGLAWNIATSICSSDTAGGSVRWAIAPSVSPRRTVTCPSAGAGANAAGASCDGACGAAGLGACGAAATGGAGAAGTAATAGGAGGGAACSRGGSSSTVYWRTRRPVAQVSSSMTSTKGSWTARSPARRSTARPSGRRSSVTRVPGSTGLNSSPAAR